MSEPKDSLYDLSDAIVLSRRLAGEAKKGSPSPIKTDDAPYIRFSTGIKSAIETARAPSVPVPSLRTGTEAADLPTAPFHSWEEVLKWCIDFSKAKCGFIVDSQGFVMITDGKDVPADAFEGAGANLGGVFSNLDQMELASGKPLIADLTYEQKAFLAIRIVDHAGEHCTIGLIAEGNEQSWPKHAVYRQIMKNMSTLLL